MPAGARFKAGFHAVFNIANKDLRHETPQLTGYGADDITISPPPATQKYLCLSQRLPCLVFGRELRRHVERPLDADGRVVPGNAALMLRRVVVSGFAEKIS
jgi:hypothetical protein